MSQFCSKVTRWGIDQDLEVQNLLKRGGDATVMHLFRAYHLVYFGAFLDMWLNERDDYIDREV